MNVMRKSILFSVVAALFRCANPDLSGPSGEGNGSGVGGLQEGNGSGVGGLPEG